MPLAIVCSGQGGQHADMFLRLADGDAAKPILAHVEALTGLPFASGSVEADAETLSANRAAQILVAGHALAAFAELVAHGLEPPVVFAGYSAGEIAAHGCAGAFSAAATLDLMAARAACMDAACQGAHSQAMLATIGISVRDARELADGAGVEVAIVNGPDHVVVGGSVEAVARYETAAAARARHVRRLGVRVASHTRLLAAAGPCFAAAVSTAGWLSPRAPVLSGLDGHAVGSDEDAARCLSTQLHEPLDWSRCLECLFEYGATAILEIGPGRALTKMVEEAYPDAPARAFDDFRTPAGAAAWADRHA